MVRKDDISTKYDFFFSNQISEKKNGWPDEENDTEDVLDAGQVDAHQGPKVSLENQSINQSINQSTNCWPQV